MTWRTWRDTAAIAPCEAASASRKARAGGDTPIPACDVIGMTALSVAAVVFLGAVVPRAEMKEPTTTTAVTMNDARRDEPSTPPSNPRPREGEG